VADDVAEALVAALKADGEIAAAVGARVYPQGAVPRTATLPRITYQQVSARATRSSHGFRWTAGASSP
jgi:hypothetical protein